MGLKSVHACLVPYAYIMGTLTPPTPLVRRQCAIVIGYLGGEGRCAHGFVYTLACRRTLLAELARLHVVGTCALCVPVDMLGRKPSEHR